MPRRRLLFIPLLLLAGLAEACATARSAPLVAVEKTEPKPPRPEIGLVSVVAVQAPEGLKLDGLLNEWGTLLPPEAVAKEGAFASGPLNPRDAPSHVAIALRSDGAVIAGELSEVGREGVWVGIAVPVPPVLSIGDYQNGGGVWPFSCDVVRHSGERIPANVSRECHLLVEEHVKFLGRHDARFSRWYRIDPSGVRAVFGDYALQPVEGATVAFRATPNGATFEATVPAKALPRMVEAPVTSLMALARGGDGAVPPPVKPTEFVPVTLPEPVGFAPWAALRARELEQCTSSPSPLGRSYQPGDGLAVEWVAWRSGGTSAVDTKSGTLFRKVGSIGDIDIGVGEWSCPFVVTARGEQIVEIGGVSGERRAVVSRGDEVHLVLYSEEYMEDCARISASWRVIAIDRAGSIREDIVSHEDEHSWDTVTAEFHSASFDVLGLRGLFDATKGEYAKRVWRYDAATKTYVVEVPAKKEE